MMFGFFVIAALQLLKICTALSHRPLERDGAADKVSGVAPLLDIFQVEAPLRASYEGASCKQVLIEHEFANSYGTPYVGTYSPPENCKFTTTIFNLSIISYGINYDRLGLIYFGDIELWRLTTAMPVRTGISFNYQKDMTIFNRLLRSEQKVIMTMDNIQNSVFTGTWNLTLTALYFDDHETLTPADEILPISSRSSSENRISVFSLPDGNATSQVTLPRNAERAVVQILASGNGAEEFWFRNVVTEYRNTFNNSVLYGYSPFREVQLVIDEKLAGVSWPFPIVFTGGISPALWVPIVGIDTYDIPSFEIDISPWLGSLCDGNSHTFKLKVVGYDSNSTFGTINSNWWISGSLFVWTDPHSNQTTGSPVQSSMPPPNFQLTPHVINENTTLYSKLTARRSLSHTAQITTSSGTRSLTWSQDLSYSNVQEYTNKGYNKTLSQITRGSTKFSAFEGRSTISNSYSWPIYFTSDNLVPVNPQTTNQTLVATIDRSSLKSTIPILPYLTRSVSPTFPELLATRQAGNAIYFWNNTLYEFAGAIDPAKGTLGVTEQWYSHIDSEGAYGRYVKAVDGYEPALVVDREFGIAISVPETQLAAIDSA